MKTKNLQYLVTSATRHLKEAKVTWAHSQLVCLLSRWYDFNFYPNLDDHETKRKVERVASQQQIKQLKLQLLAERQKKLQAQKTQKQMMGTLRKIRVRLCDTLLRVCVCVNAACVHAFSKSILGIEVEMKVVRVYLHPIYGCMHIWIYLDIFG